MPDVVIEGTDTTLSFPDSMSPADIKKVLDTHPTVLRLRKATKTPAAAATKPVQAAKRPAAGKAADTSYRGTGASISAKPEPNLFERGLEVLTAPFAKVDEMAARAILESGGASKEAQERYRKLGMRGLRDLPFWERIDPEMIRGISQTPVMGGIARFGLGLATPSAAIPIGGAAGAVAKGGKAATAGKAVAGALGAGAVYGGSRQVKQGIEGRDVNTAVEGGLNVLLGALTLGTLRQWQADTGVKLTPQQEKVILQAPPKNRPNIARRFAKIQEARAKDVPTRMPPVTPTPAEAAPVPAKTAKARKTRRPAKSEPIPAVGDNQPLGNEAAAPQPAPVGSGGRGDVALPAEPVPAPQAEAVPPVQRGLEAGAEAALEAALEAVLTRQDVTAQATYLRNRLNEFHKRQPSLLPDPRNGRELSLYDTSDNKRIREGRLKTYREAVYLGIEEDIVALSRQGRVIPEIYEAIRARVPGLSLSDLQEMVPTVRRAHNLDVADPIRPPEKMRQDIPPTLSLSEKVIALTQQIRTLPYEQLLELQKTPAYREIADMPAHFIPDQLVEEFQSAIKARIIERRNIQAGRKHAAIPTIDTNPQESAQVTARAQMEKASAKTGLTPSQHAYLVQKLGQVRDTQSPDPVRIPVPGDGEFTVTGKQAGALIKSLPKAPKIPKAATPVHPPQAPVAAPPENGLHTIRLTDFLAEAGEKGLDLTDAMRMHKAAVQQALDAGLPVDKEVLKPYPGMKKGGAANAVPQQETAGGLLRQAEAGAGEGVGLPRLGGQDRPIETAGEGQAQAAQVAPQVETPTAKLPEYLQEDIDRRFATAQKAGIVQDVEALSAQRLTAWEVVAALSDRIPGANKFEKKDIVQGVRTKLGIPSMDDATEFEAWLRGRSLPPVETPTERIPEGPTVKLPKSPETPTAKLPETPKITDQARNVLDTIEAAAKKRLDSGLSMRIDAGLVDYAIIGAVKLAKKGLDFADWSAEMVAEYGEKIKPHLQDIWEAAHDYYNNALRKRLPELPELTLPKAAQAAKPDAPKGNTEQPSLRHRDMQAIAAELGVGLDPKITESWQRVTDRALREYDSILSTLKHYDPDTSPTPTDEEKIVAGARIGEIRRELNPLLAKKENVTKEEAARITALELESGQLLNLVTKAGSGSARSLNLQKLLLPDDPTDPTAVLLRAQRLAGGELSIPARRTLTRLAEEAKTATDAAEAKVNARRPREARKPQEKTFGQDNTVFTKEKYAAAQARLKEKLGRASVSIDPTMLSDLVEIGGYYFEGGLREFAGWAKQVKQDLPELTDDDMKLVWRSLQTRARTEKLLSRLGTVEARPAALLDDATLAYAKGARDLHRFATALRKKHAGTTFTEAELNKLFREAAEQYHKDFRQVEAIKRQMTEVVAKEVYRQKPWYGKIWHGAKELNNLSRSLILGPDISFLFRQGGPLVANRFLRMNKAALPEMWRALQREEVARAIDASIRHGKNGDLYEKAGLDFSDIEPGTKPGQEEGIASDWLQKVPGVRRPYRAADRANTVMINKLRAETFDLLYDPQKHNLEQAKAIARYINVATGRGDLSNAAIAGLVRGTADVFLSPRYMVSRFQYLIGLPLWKAPKGARKLIAKEYANYYLRVGLFLGLASQIPGVEVEADPRSSDFATVRIGDVNIDILSGLKQPVTMSARVLPLGEWGHKNFLTEEKKAIPIDPFRTFLNFFLYKMSPLPQLGADVALRQGKDFKGDPLTVGGVSRRLFLNITAQDVVEALLEKGIDPKTALELGASALVSQVGAGANLRDRAEEAKKRAKKAEARKEAAQEKDRVDRILQRLTDPIVPNVPNGVLVGPGTF